MVVTQEEDKEFVKCLQNMVDGDISIPTLMEEIETGIIHKKDNIYTVDGRWDFEYKPRTDVVLVGDDFMKVVTAATYAVGEEWGGLIFGKVIKFRDNCNIFICEKVAIMAQVRGPGDFEIKDDHYQEWARTDEFIEFMKADCARIGWVHSHVHMGCFWSGTDHATIKQLIEKESNDHIISLVVSKRSDKKLDTKYLTSNRGVHNGIQFRIPEPNNSEVPVERIIYEIALPCLDDFAEEYQASMVERMKGLTVIERHPHQQSIYNQSAVGQWRGVAAGGAGKQIIAIPQFILVVSDHDVKVREFLETKKKWKMKQIIAEIPKEKLIKLLDFFLKTSNRIQSYLITYNNFDNMSTSFLDNVINYSNKNAEFREVVKTRYGEAWPVVFRNSLIKRTYATTTTPAYQRPVTEPDWDDVFFDLEEKYQRGLMSAILSAPGLMFKEATKKTIDGIGWRVRNEESTWVDSFVGIYMALYAYRAKYRKKKTVEVLDDIIEKLLTEMFKSYRGKSAGSKKALQMVVNCLPDKLLIPFMHDFIANFDTEEELDALYAKGDITVRHKMYACPICENWWVTKKDAKKCEKICKNIEKKKFTDLKKPTEIKPVSSTTASPKEQTASTHQTTLAGTINGKKPSTAGTIDSTDKSITTSYTGENICGMTPNYWKAETVCNYCGMEYPTSVGAQLCEKCCAEDVETYILDLVNLQGYAICSLCGFVFVNEKDVIAHTKSCEMTGMGLHTKLCLNALQRNLIIDKEKNKNFVKDFNEFLDLVCLELDDLDSNAPPALYPPIISWLINVGEEKASLWYCGKCGLTFEGFDVLDGIYIRYYHEKFCNGRKSLHTAEFTGFARGTIPIKYMYSAYFCGLCDFTVGYPNEVDLMQHMKEEHKTDLSTAVFSVIVDNATEVYKELYPGWQEAKFAAGTPLNQCTYCKVTFLDKDKMEDNSKECFEHEFKCGRRFPRD
jgi:hypothetical protein